MRGVNGGGGREGGLDRRRRFERMILAEVVPFAGESGGKPRAVQTLRLAGRRVLGSSRDGRSLFPSPDPAPSGTRCRVFRSANNTAGPICPPARWRLPAGPVFTVQVYIIGIDKKGGRWQGGGVVREGGRRSGRLISPRHGAMAPGPFFDIKPDGRQDAESGSQPGLARPDAQVAGQVAAAGDGRARAAGQNESNRIQVDQGALRMVAKAQGVGVQGRFGVRQAWSSHVKPRQAIQFKKIFGQTQSHRDAEDGRSQMTVDAGIKLLAQGCRGAEAL